MSDFEDAIGDATATLLDEAGVDCVYIRGVATSSITLRKSSLPPMTLDQGNGMFVEVFPVDFIGRTIDLPYLEPLQGDLIKYGGESFQVNPVTSEKCFRRISVQMTRIHTKRVK